jgi:FMN-dependent oxidoreductase (nitrilotriacetate monooxygenase family)
MSRDRERQLKLGFILHGNGVGWGDWRHKDAQPDASTDFRYYKEQARLAEAGKFDFLFCGDSVSISPRSSPHHLNRFEPITVLSGLAAVTEHIGLVATVSVSYSEPYNIARQLASLDQMSGGRAGWNVVTSWLSGTAENFSRQEHPAHHTRYKIADEYLNVVQGLWDSWEDDALTHDRASGQFFDPAKLHALNHKGEYFSVAGPLNIARSAQGQPVIFQAGVSEDGLDFSARRAEAVFVGHTEIEPAKLYYRDLKRRAASYGRAGEGLFVLPAVRPVIGLTAEDAEEKYQELANLVSIEGAIRLLGSPFNGHDFSVYPLDEPFPNVEHIGVESLQSTVLKITRMAREEKLTLRQTALRFASPRSQFIGTPTQVADAMQQWLEEEAADGFLMLESLPGQLKTFVERVVPLLQERGLLRKEYEKTTFRGNLGLPFVENRYSRARRRDAAE